MENSYTFGQILFALRKEYLEIQKQLEQLKKYVIVGDELENFHFDLMGNPCYMMLYLERKQKILDKLFKKITKNIIYSYDVSKEVSKEYFLEKQLLCQIPEPNKLSQEINTLLYSEFASNMRDMRAFQHCLGNEKDIMKIEVNQMSLWTLPDDVTDYHHHLKYFPQHDQIILKEKKHKLHSSDIYHIFQLHFDATKLNEYQREKVEQYGNPEIIIDGNIEKNQVSFAIEENAKKIILKPTAYKHK